MENSMIHPETGKILYRDVRPVEFSYKGEKFTVNMPGWYPADDSDAIFSHEDTKVCDEVVLKIRARQAKEAAENKFESPAVAIA